MRNFFAKFIVVVGMLLAIVSGFLLTYRYSSYSGIHRYDGDIDAADGERIIVSGKTAIIENARDEELGIEADSPILVRNVEMVQWFKDDKGTRLVLANYPLEDVDGHENPDFPSDLRTRIFYGKLAINDEKLLLGENILKSIAQSERKDLVELGEGNGNRYGLVLVDGAYVTASDEWEAGDIRVSYSYVDKDAFGEYTILGNKAGNIVDIDDGEDTFILNGIAEDSAIRQKIAGNIYLYVGGVGMGIAICVLGFLLMKKEQI